MDEVDAVCEEIAESMAEAGSEMMLGMCANEGQTTLIDQSLEDFVECCMEAAQGDANEFEADHMEAVGEIVEVGNAIIEMVAEMCQALRDAAALFGDF